ncbi:MAG: hypothetical protein IJF18_01060 [Oscillospiraceae bacterium]|nr:hypothetical protein [Oscillospiraceae bacterium]
MKNTKRTLTKFFAAALALCLSAALFSGCKKDTADSGNPSETSATTNATVAPEDIPVAQGKRPVAEGDVLAINKFTVDPLPADYVLVDSSQEYQGKVYMNGVSKVTVMASNYKEDFQDLDISAESAAAGIKMNNMLMASDTDFEDPVYTKVAGFDTVSRDFLVTVNEFSEVNGKEVKTPVAWYKSRIIYFFSEKDVFYCIFETTKNDWDSTIGGFEEFVANIVIDENAVNPPAETTAAAEGAASEEVVSETSAS